MQRAVLEKDILNQAGIDIGPDHITCALIVGERYRPLHDNKGASFGFRHVHAGIHHRQNPLLLVFNFGLVLEDFRKHLEASPRAQLGEKALDFVLEQNHEDEQADVDELVHDGADEAHVHHLVHHHPSHDERQDANEDVERT